MTEHQIRPGIAPGIAPGISERGAVPDWGGEPDYPRSLDLLFAASVVLTAAGSAMMLAATAVYIWALLT